ncbi:peroxide stress protein YaaA [Magnetococcales bacterium HHB-1]
MLSVLSPAKKLAMDIPKGRPQPTQPAFLSETRQLLDLVQKKDVDDFRQLMKISDALAELTYQRFQQFIWPMPMNEAVSALFAFQGDTYVGLRAEQFSEEDILFAQQRLRIISGLFGLLRPLDGIQAYRLEMGTRLENPAGKSLYVFWGDLLAEEINRLAEEESCTVLVNLASKEYFRALSRRCLKPRVITPVFKEMRNGVAKVLGFPSKRARGAMAHFMIKERLERPEDLKQFNWNGYRFQKEDSDEETLVFLKSD